MKQRFVLIHSPEGIRNAKARLAPPAPEALPDRPTVSGQRRFRKAARAQHLRVTVGIWSLNAWLGDLAELIEALNRTQNTFVFYEVEATVPAGLISRPERMNSWLTEVRGKKEDYCLADEGSR